MEDSSRRTSISTSTSTHESVISATTRTTSTTAIPRIGNINSPSVSLASVSSGEDEIRAGNGSLLLRKGSSHDSSHELNSNFDNLAAVVDQLANMTMASSSSNSDLQNSELHVEVRRLKDSLARLRQVFEDCADRPDAIRKAAHERLGEVLKILRQMLEKYPTLQTEELVNSASQLITHVKHFNYDLVPNDPNAAQTAMEFDLREFHDTLDTLTTAFTSRVSEYIMGNSDFENTSSAAGLKSGLRQHMFPYGDTDDDQEDENSNEMDKDLHLMEHPNQSGTIDQIDSVLMRHDLGVDLALDRTKVWSKYAKDVLFYVEKRINLEMDWAKNLTKLSQEQRKELAKESHLPFQSIYCFALDIPREDLEICASTQTTCALLEDYKFLEPLRLQREKHERTRKRLKERWKWERKRLQEVVVQLNKAQVVYYQRHQDYERCREALRIAEQGAEIGATGENKVEKRKRLEEEAMQKTVESESHYRSCVEEANERHRHIQLVKTDILREIRELTIECDEVMKEVTVNYFQQLHALTVTIPTQYATMCESSRLYEPGSQFMEYIKRLPESSNQQHTTLTDPFRFEPFSGDTSMVTSKSSKGGRPFAFPFEAGEDHRGHRGREAWTPSMGAIEPSDTESVESGRSSPSGSPLVGGVGSGSQLDPIGGSGNSGGKADHHPVIYFDSDTTDRDLSRPPNSGQNKLAKVSATSSDDHDHGSGVGHPTSIRHEHGHPTSPTTPPRRPQVISMSKASLTHHFRKIKHPSTSKCRECENHIVIFNGYSCTECGLASHRKCLEQLSLQCGHRRLPRKVAIFGVDLSNHLLDTGAQVPPIVIRCVQEINSRGLSVQGIYRVSGAKQRIDRLSQAFENGPDLVDLTNIPPNVIADVLKNYMRQLPEPLLTFSLCPEFIRVAEAYPASIPIITTTTASTTTSTTSTSSTTTSTSVEKPEPEVKPLTLPADIGSSPPSKGGLTSPSAALGGSYSNLDDEQKTAINRLRELTRRLPKPHYHTLAYLMHHLSRVAADESNSMTASNLAIVFAPTLMKTSQENLGMDAVGETKHHARVIELLIAYVNYIFGPVELHMPQTSSMRNNDHHSVRGPHARSQRSSARNKGGGSGSSRDNSDLISSQTERRNVQDVDEFNIPGLVSSDTVGSNEDIFGASVSDEDDDAEPIPLFLLNDSSGRPGKSPLLLRGNSSPPKIIKQSLKNFSGLEGVTPGMLSTQDSLEVAQQRILGSTSSPSPLTSSTSLSSAPTTSTAQTAKRLIHHESSMPVASSSEVSTAVFHKVNPRLAKKNSIDSEEFFDQDHHTDTTSSTTAASDVVDGLVGSAGGGGHSDVKSNSRTLSSSISNSASTSSARSGSLSEDHIGSRQPRMNVNKQLSSSAASTSHGSRDNLMSGSASSNLGGASVQSQPQIQQQQQQPPMSQSMPTTILNIEENRVTIQVPGVQSSNVQPRTSQHPTVVKQSSAEKEDD